MRRLTFAFTIGLALAMMPASAVAQGRGRGNAKAKANGPAFCRTGGGHPVYGRAWCVQKGFGLGNQDWRRVDHGVIVLKHEVNVRVERAGLLEILGEILLSQLELRRAALHDDSPLTGRWLTPPDGARVLQVWAGAVPLSEVVDNDRDGSVDLVVMNFGR